MNIIKVSNAMTKGEMDFITTLIEQDARHIDLTKWQFEYATTHLTKSQKVMVYRAIKGLKAKGLIKKVSKATYIINPEFITPPDSVLMAANDLWINTP